MESEQTIREEIDGIVAGAEPLATARARWNSRYPDDSHAFRRRSIKAWVRQAAAYKQHRQWGRFRRAVMLAASVLGRPSIIEIEQAGILLPNDVPSQEFETCLRHLARQLAVADDDGLADLVARVRTYRAYAELSSAVEERGQRAKRLLAQRPFPFGRTLIAFTNLFFLREQFLFETGSEFEALFAEHGTPEHLAEAASTIIALANEVRPLESYDFTFPLGGIDVSDEFISVLRYGAAICALRETGKLISILNYEITRERSAAPRIYRLRAPYEALEYALRLGFIRREVGTTASGLYVSRLKPAPLHSMLAGAEDLLSRMPQLIELKDPDTPIRRIRLQTPLFPGLWQTLSRVRFYEDALRDERLAQESELPMRVPDSGDWMLVPGIDLPEHQDERCGEARRRSYGRRYSRVDARHSLPNRMQAFDHADRRARGPRSLARYQPRCVSAEARDVDNECPRS